MLEAHSVEPSTTWNYWL